MSDRSGGQKIGPQKPKTFVKRMSGVATLTNLDWIEGVCGAVAEDFPSAKHAARATGASVETARNWLAKRCAPHGAHLGKLIHASPKVRSAVFRLSGCDELARVAAFDADYAETKERMERLTKEWADLKAGRS